MVFIYFTLVLSYLSVLSVSSSATVGAVVVYVPSFSFQYSPSAASVNVSSVTNTMFTPSPVNVNSTPGRNLLSSSVFKIVSSVV